MTAKPENPLSARIRKLRPLSTANGPIATSRKDTRRVGITQNSVSKTTRAIEELEHGSYRVDAGASEFSRSDRAKVTLDPSQSAAIDLLKANQYACIIGYAGTGKTTIMSEFLPDLEQQVSRVDWGAFRTVGENPSGHRRPAIALCTFANVAARNLAAKLPEEWSAHCMSIHSCLAFAPTFEDEIHGGEQKMRFDPRYNADNKLPLDALIIDEAGIIPRDLWHQILDAAPSHMRIYFLGDLAQLPAVQGVSPMPFAMRAWPTAVLDKIYRQSGDSQIIPNLTRIRKGLPPVHASNDFRCGPQEILPKGINDARKKVTEYIAALHKLGFWDPKQDIIITPENEATLGQRNFNGAFRLAFNPPKYDEAGKITNPPIMVRTAEGAIHLAVGDKIMATDNGGRRSTEKRFNNGSIGIVTSIEPNPKYTGYIDDVDPNQFTMDMSIADIYSDMITAEEMHDDMEAELDNSSAEEKKSRQASHIVTVVEQATGDTFILTRAGEVGTLQHAYAATCHKFQGSQARHVLVIAHTSMRFGLNRNWLYTACSRAQKKVFLLHEPEALNRAVINALIKGDTAYAQADRLIDLYQSSRDWAMPKLPDAAKL